MLSDNGILLDEMLLIHYGKKDVYFEELGLKTVFIDNFFDPFSNLKLIKPLYKADKVIVHSLAAPFLLLLIAMFPKIGAKVNWVIWGKDLYFYHLLENPKFYHKAYEWLREKAFMHIETVLSIFREDYELAQEWYQIKAKNIEMISLYPYALSLKTIPETKKKKEKVIVLLGNSASKTNNHLEALEKLESNKDFIEKIYCPLSYGGSKAYSKQVMEAGKERFGEKFIPFIQFIPKEEYFNILQEVDIGVFNYSRQEGLGNIWSLIMSKKTIYMKENTSTTSFFKRNGIKVLDIDTLQNTKIHMLSSEVLDSNVHNLEPLINVDASMQKWAIVLGERKEG